MNPRLLTLCAGVLGLAGLALYDPRPAPTPPPKAAPAKPAPKVDPKPDCPDGKCPPRRKPWGERLFVPVGTTYAWSRWDGTREYALMDGTRQLGSYDAEAGVYRAVEGKEWGPKTWLPAGVPHPEGEAQGGPVGPNGVEVQCEVPLEFRMRNIGSRVDGAGMCVMTTTEVGAEWAGLTQWKGVRNWAAKFPGGSMPGKHLSQLARYAKEKGLAEVPWAQYVGRDPAPFLDAVLGSGRVCCVSWFNSGHWLNLVHLDQANACILDNNGDPANLKWMTRESCIRQINAPYAWVGCWLPPGPPPPPKNSGVQAAPPCPEARAERMPEWSSCTTQGVFLDGLVGAGELTIRGRPGTIEQLRAELGSAADPRVTVIGTPEAASTIVDALAAKNVKAVAYPPDAWQVRGLGFLPGVYLQSADGTVLHRQDGSDLDALAEAIRRANPNYDPKLDPAPVAPGLPLTGGDPTALVVLAGGAAAVVAAGRWARAKS